jgi:polyferredoxin
MERKQWKRRLTMDAAPRWRAAVQAGFLVLNLWIGVSFLVFVRRMEGGWTPWEGARPAGVEGWLPIAGLMNLKYFLLTGEVPVLHPAAMVLVLTFLLLSLFFRKAFCGWLCPVGTISEWLWKLGRETFGRNFSAPKWLDLPLRALKYVLLSAFLYAVWGMGAAEIDGFLRSPYGLIADVKMLNFFRYLSPGAAMFLAVMVMVSVFVQNAWCRYLCPYGALMGLAALLSPARIRREAEACIDCGKCAKACPSRLPVDRLVQIRSAECLGCMECVAACPAEGALALAVAGRRMAGGRMALAVVLVFVGMWAGARWSGHWESAIPEAVYRELVPEARWMEHPRYKKQR